LIEQDLVEGLVTPEGVARAYGDVAAKMVETA
jgi:hypothetical protein